jgi:hypothetical protein
MIFGPSQARTMRVADALLVARFLRNEPLWPLLKAIWTFRRMDARTFGLLDDVGDPFNDPPPKSRA